MASTNIQSFPGKVGVSNTNPIHTLDIGSNVYIDDTSDTKIRVYGNIHASGVTVDGSITVIETDNLSVKDPVLLLASGSTGTSDTGIIMKRADGDANVAIFYDEGVGLNVCHTLSGGDEIHLSVDGSNALATSIYGPVHVVNTGTEALVVDGGSKIDGNLQVGTVGDLFVDTVTSNVGVGTNSPAYKLDVHGTSNVGALTATSITASTVSAVTVNSNVVSDNVVATSGFYGAIQGSNTIAGSTGTFSSNLEVGTANLFVDTVTSNVGIGTDTPAYKLDVHGSANVAALTATLTYSNASANIVAWNSSTNEVIDSGIERGFTEHPVAPMTDYTTYVEGHGTYEVRVSSDATGLFGSYGSPFDYVIGNNMWESAGNWSSSNVYNNSNWTTDVGGTRHYGEWLELKLPYPIVLSHTDVYPRTNIPERGPGGGVIVGSNDGMNWYKLTEFSGKTYTNGVATKIDVNATTAYTWYRIVTSKLADANASDVRLDIGEWRLFAEKSVTRMENVHISGALSSETLHTSHIKWPKVPLKANESEGYVASASSVFNSTGFPAWAAFEDKSEYIYPDAPAWGSFNGSFSAGVAQTTRTTGTDTFAHEWLQIQLPQAIQLSYFNLTRRDNDVGSSGEHKSHEAAKSGFMYGSNDGVTWTKLVPYNDLTYVDYQPTRVNVESTRPYTYYRLAVTHTTYTSGDAAWVGINELQLFESTVGVGTSATTAKLTVEGGLGLAKGSQVFAGSDVVMELPRHERPLTKYPEVAMTSGASNAYENGYKVTFSRESGSYPAWKAFDNDPSDAVGWYSGDGNADIVYNGTNGAYSGTTRLASETVLGEWIGLEVPSPIKLHDVRIVAQNYSKTTNTVDDFVIYAKKHSGDTWTNLGTFTGIAALQGTAAGVTVNVNSTDYYKFFTLVATKRYAQSINGVSIRVLDFYGTEEGDTSVDVVHRSIPNTPGQQQLAVYWDANDSASYSFADSSNVYDLSGSGVKGTLTGGVGFDAEYNAFTFDGVDDYISGTLTTTVDNWVHSISMWVYIDNSDANGTLFFAGNAAQRQAIGMRQQGKDKMYYYFFSYDALFNYESSQNQWVHLVFTYDGGTDEGATVGGYGVSRKFYVDTTEQTLSSITSTGQTLDLQSTSTGFSIGGRFDYSEPFTGKIANVRVFSKKLSIEQIRELYEYDAERFGHRQNLVALHKGNLGVGVAHPTARFEVAGADGLQEYPPKAMTGFETYMEGHGVFRASASSEYTAAGPYSAWEAFDSITGGTSYWSAAGQTYTTSNPPTLSYTGTAFATNVEGVNKYGEWLQIEFPHKVKYSHSTILAPTSHEERVPRDGYIVGSNDLAGQWTTLHRFEDVTRTTTTETVTYTPPSAPTHYFKYFRLVIEALTTGGGQYAGVNQWDIFGTPAPSSLEDGHLTLGKALTLPRVSGHGAGAETPRAESLVVHYDTTVDSVVSGTSVVDISGNGSNGTLNGVTYNSTNRCLHGDGPSAGDYTATPITLTGGAMSLSIGMWFRAETLAPSANDYRILSLVGTKATGQAFIVSYSSTHLLQDWYGKDFRSSKTLQSNTWYHVLTTYNGGNIESGSSKIYLNGVELSGSTSYTGTLNLPTTETSLELFDYVNASNDRHHGDISNFKIWGGVALTAEEVAMEYALGRTGKSLNLTDTALCLGGTVPRAQLDVRGSALVGGNVGIGTTSPTTALQISRSFTGAGDTSAMISFENTTTSFYEWQIGPTIINNAASFVIKGGADGFGNLSNIFVIRDTSVGIGYANPSCPLDFGSPIQNKIISLWGSSASDTVFYGFGVNNSTLRYNTAGASDVHKFYGGSTEYGYINDATGFVNSFTGQHKSFPHASLFGKTSDDLCGLIVSASGEYISINDNVPQKGQGAIQVSEAIPTVKLSVSEKDKKVFGVVSDVEDVESAQRHDHYGAFVSTFEKERGDSRIYVNSIGEGAMWVVNTAGSLESGDYITTSNVAGYGQKQDSEFLANYTVAKITMDCDFEPATQPVQRVVKELSNVNYWVKTTYSNVTQEEYSILADENRTTTTETVYVNENGETFTEQDEQSTYTELTRTVYQRITMEESKTEQEGYEVEVRQELVNVLDEHGQLQWEDTDQTEKAYKIRYLTANGTQTDEANAVHIAAFVGCTYHCG